MYRLVLIFVISIAATACDNDSGRKAQVMDAPATSGVVSGVSPTAVATVGDEESAPLFAVVGATILDDQVVIANGGNATLVYADTAGQIEKSVGRRGSGPGEFANITWLSRCSTSPPMAYVYDRGQSRMSVFDAQGELIRTYGVGELEGRVPYRLACNHGGAFLAVEWPFPRNVAGPYRADAGVAFLDGDGRYTGTLARFLGPERYRHASSDGPRPFGMDLYVAVGHNRLYVGTAEEYAIAEFSASGDPLDTIRWEGPQRDVRAEHVDTYIDNQLSGLEGEERRRRERGWRQMEFPERFPAYQAVLVDPFDRVWVQEYARPGQERTTWWVFNPDYELEAQVETPAGLQVFEIDENYLVGLNRNEFDAEVVELYRVERRS